MKIRSLLDKNPFEAPQKYRDIILNSRLLEFKKINLDGKSLACLFLTRFCSVGCSFCFFKSSPPWRKAHIEDQFSDEGIEKFIQFSKCANLGYLLISGGGEPLNQRKHILKIVEKVTADNIVLVTSGNWAKNKKTAEIYLEDIYSTLERRLTPARLVVRISVSEGHSIKLGVECAKNIISIFEEKYAHKKNFVVQIKAFENDKALDKLIQELLGAKLSDTSSKLVSDNKILIKRIPEKYLLKLANGYEIIVGLSKVFHSSLKADLKNIPELEKAIDVVENDLQFCEEDNPSVVSNNNGEKGLDWSINFNGNVCIWQNQVRDTYMNLYQDSYNKIIETYLNDPITYSFVEKGSSYRDRIISEVNPTAVLRSKGIGLRDSVGAILFEEEKTRLYYAIRILQEYIKEGRIKLEAWQTWPKEILSLIQCSQEELKILYKSSSYSIVTQQMQKIFNEEEWYDFLELIKLGHYELSDEEIALAINFYNQLSSTKIKTLADIEPQFGDVTRRLTERLTYIKPMATSQQRNPILKKAS